MRTQQSNSARSHYSNLAAIAIAALATATMLTCNIAAADQGADYHLTRAINSLTSGNHEVAESHFHSARQAAGDTPGVNLKIGSLYIEYADDGYRHAIPFLEAAVAGNPALAVARFRLGQAYYQTDDFLRAQQTFETLLADQKFAPYTRYYLGIIALYKGDFGDAENHLTPYTKLPEALRSRARFQMARADYEQREFEKARRGFEAILEDPESAELHPGTESYLEAVERATKPWSLYGVATLRYDSNPLVIADDELISELTGETPHEDFALVLQGQGRLQLHQSPAFESEASYTLYDLRYDQMSSRDQQGHIFALDGTWFGKRTDFSVGYAHEHWSLDNEKFQRGHRLSTTLTHQFTPTTNTEFGYRYSYINRYDDQSRSGPRHRFHVQHQFPSYKGWQLDLAYRLQHADTDEVHEFRSNELGLELNGPEFYGWHTALEASYDWTRFPDAGTSGHRDRDDSWRVAGSVTRKLMDNLYLRLGSSYEENDSDDPLYSYDRYQFDIGLIASF